MPCPPPLKRDHGKTGQISTLIEERLKELMGEGGGQGGGWQLGELPVINIFGGGGGVFKIY